MLVLCLGIFLVGSALCALAPSMTFLIVARTLQGIGGGGLISLVQAAIGDAVPPRERGRYQAYVAAMWGVASVAGPVLGGIFADHLHWSIIFWINLPLGLAALWFSDATLRRLPAHHVPHRLDILGSALLVGAAVALLLALNWGGNRYAWGSGPILGLLIASAVLTAGFMAHVRRAPEPLLPLRLMRNPVASWATTAASLTSFSFFGMAVYMPVYLEVVEKLSPSVSGMTLLPLMGGTVVGASTAGRLSVRLVHYRRPAIVGLGAAIAASIVLALGSGQLPLWGIMTCLAIVGIGIGAMFPIGSIALQNAVERRDIGIGTAYINFFRSLLGALGVAAFGALTASALHVVGRTGDAAPLIAAFAMAFWVAAAGFAAGLASLLRMEEKPLRG
jgi:MFS family permease